MNQSENQNAHIQTYSYHTYFPTLNPTVIKLIESYTYMAKVRQLNT